MRVKGKFLSIASILALAIVLTLVGVWAVADLDFIVGGNITYTAPEPEVEETNDYPYLIFTITDSTNKYCSVGINRSASCPDEIIVPAYININDVSYMVTTVPGSYTDGTGFAGASMTSIILPDTISTIQGYAFQYCSSLTQIKIPYNVTYIGYNAFMNDSNLSKIYSHAKIPPTLANDVFCNCPADLIIYVPSGSVEAYKSADYWSNYADKIQAGDF